MNNTPNNNNKNHNKTLCGINDDCMNIIISYFDIITLLKINKTNKRFNNDKRIKDKIENYVIEQEDEKRDVFYYLITNLIKINKHFDGNFMVLKKDKKMLYFKDKEEIIENRRNIIQINIVKYKKGDYTDIFYYDDCNYNDLYLYLLIQTLPILKYFVLYNMNKLTYNGMEKIFNMEKINHIQLVQCNLLLDEISNLRKKYPKIDFIVYPRTS